jgi:phosphoribosylformylglycinamidine cyclo-ligase
MQSLGNVSEFEMYRTFNMGVGMVVVTAAENVQAVKAELEESGPVFEIGRVVRGNREVTIK